MMEIISQYFIINPENGLVELTWPIIIILVVAGFLVGIINTIAGSGTVITYSLFMILGLPANIANGTIRFGVIMQTLASSATFYKGGKLDVKKGLILAIPVVMGTLIGAQIATHLDKQIFEKVLGIVMISMVFFIFYDPKSWIKGQIEKVNQRLTIFQLILFFFIGIYGGFIHIGVGIFLLAILVLNVGYDLVKANALKVFIVLLYSPFALGIFIINNQVDYRLGLISAIGNVFGGIIASRLAIKKGAGFIRWFLLVVIVLFSLKLLLN